MKLSKFSSDLSSKWSVGPKWSEALTRTNEAKLHAGQWKDFAGRVMSCETPLGIRLGLIQGTPQQMTFLLGRVNPTAYGWRRFWKVPPS